MIEKDRKGGFMKKIIFDLENNPAVKMVTNTLAVIYPEVAYAGIAYSAIRKTIFKEEIANLNYNNLKIMLKDDKFVHLIFQTYHASLRSKEKEKVLYFTKFFKTVVENGELNDTESNELEEYINIITDLSYREIMVAHKIREFTFQNIINKGIKVQTNFNTISLITLKKYKNPREEWDKVVASLITDFDIKYIGYFFIKLLNSGFIEACYCNGSKASPIYTSTPYFERLFKLIPELENYPVQNK